MRRLTALLFSLCLLAALSTDSAAGTVIQNLGDFEDGGYGPWQRLSVGGASDWWVNGGTTSDVSSSPTYPPTGAYQAVSDWDDAYVTTFLYRTVTIPSNADSLKLRLWYKSQFVMALTSLTPGSQGQGLRVDLQSTAQSVTTLNGILATPFNTLNSGPNDFAPVTVAVGVQSLRGQTVRLRIAAMSNDVPMIAGVDDVRLEGTQYVEVAGTGLPNLRDGAADWGDFDNDGDLDLALEGFDGTARASGIYRNTGGTFSLFATPPDGISDGDVKWVDTDRDGDLDVVFNGSRASAAAWTYVGRNLGNSFTWSFVTYDAARCNLAIGDYDADGDQDLLTNGSGRINLYRNDGIGGFDDVWLADVSGLDSSFVALDARTTYPTFAVYGSAAGAPTKVSYANNNSGADFTRTATGTGLSAAFHTETGTALGFASCTFLAGRSTGSPALVGSVTNTFNGVSLIEDVPGLYDASAAWCDENHDGVIDLFVTGSTDNGAPYTRLHRGTPNTLTASTDAFTAVSRSACAMGDYDNDGDLDILVLGQSASGPVTKLYRNDIATPNAPPAAPSPGSVNVLSGGTGVQLGTAGDFNDDHTPFVWRSFNFRAGTRPGGVDIISPDSDPVTGTRRVARAGNSRGASNYTLSSAFLTSVHVPVYFAAQSVDGQFKGSPWSAESVMNLGPELLSIADVPNDQGGALRVTLQASRFDVVNSAFPVTSYNVYGRVASATLAAQVSRVAAASPTPAAEDGSLPTVELGARRFVAPAAVQALGFPAGTWEIVASFTAFRAPTYTVRVPTVADSGAGGPNWSVFVASAHTANVAVWWTCPSDSGKSLDNIAPGAPQGVQLSYHPGTHNALSWQPSAAEDFQYFRVYRGATPNFAISPATLVGSTSDVSWTDPAAGATGVYYKITALDHAGNESAAATPSVTTDVDGGGNAQMFEFALATPSPSPFAARTTIAFTLPAAQHARLEVFDAAGRRVAKLADGTFAAGPHSVTWDGSADGGARANAGLLFVRLSAGGREAVRRVVLLGGAQ